MKRLFGLFVLLFAAILYVAGQSTARTALSMTLPESATYYKYTCAAADTVGTSQDTLTFEVLTNKDEPVNVAARVEVTRTGSTDDYEIRLQGKVFENDTWTSVVDSTAQTASLSLYHADVEVDVAQAASVTPFYRYWRILIGSDGTVAAADKLTVNYFIIKVWRR